MKVKTTERGWAGHYILSNRCIFKRNTLVEYGGTRIVVSTVGNLLIDNEICTIGYKRHYETMAFHSKEDCKYNDADVTRVYDFDSEWRIISMDRDIEANEMHENVVSEVIETITQ
tara:strand:- start:385 stop:729 length:345 start_codon:yes stop_codon:yes gene_type:complete